MEIESTSREITAFSIPSGHYGWLRMPFGLKSSPLTFQRMKSNLYADMLGHTVYAYFDDLIIAKKGSGNTLEIFKSYSSEVARGWPEQQTIQV